jgi:hypothetical protein
MATDRRTTITVVVSTLVALVTNIALDLTTSLPMLGRWAIAVAVGVAVTALVVRPRTPDSAE